MRLRSLQGSELIATALRATERGDLQWRVTEPRSSSNVGRRLYTAPSAQGSWWLMLKPHSVSLSRDAEGPRQRVLDSDLGPLRRSQLRRLIRTVSQVAAPRRQPTARGAAELG